MLGMVDVVAVQLTELAEQHVDAAVQSISVLGTSDGGANSERVHALVSALRRDG